MRSAFSALAAVLALAVPTLAFAEAPAGDAAVEKASAKVEAKAESKAEEKAEKKPAHKSKGAHRTHSKGDAHAKGEAHAKAEGADKGHAAKGKAREGAAKGKAKKTASRGPAKKKAAAKKADSDAPSRRCARAHVQISRAGLEERTIALLDCNGAPSPRARAELSVLARPWGAQRPARVEVPARGERSDGRKGLLAPGVRLLDEGLLLRLAAVTRKFPGKPIALVSGYRPGSKGSQHQSARALDFSVTGVSNEQLVAFCKTLTDTGCGYYPNTAFVHLDVRNPGTGTVSWIDASGPGEEPRYVAQWPPPADEVRETPALPPVEGDLHSGAENVIRKDAEVERGALDDLTRSPAPAPLPAPAGPPRPAAAASTDR